MVQCTIIEAVLSAYFVEPNVLAASFVGPNVSITAQDTYCSQNPESWSRLNFSTWEWMRCTQNQA